MTLLKNIDRASLKNKLHQGSLLKVFALAVILFSIIQSGSAQTPAGNVRYQEESVSSGRIKVVAKPAGAARARRSPARNPNRIAPREVKHKINLTGGLEKAREAVSPRVRLERQ